MRALPAIPIAVLLCAATLRADTNVSGSITSNTTWTLSASPYVVIGDVGVNSGVTLTIQPGVTVKFNAGKTLNLDGALSAVGTASSGILFTSSSPTPSAGSWNCLHFSGSGSSTSHLTYATISYGGANFNSSITIESSAASLDHVTESNSSTNGVRVIGTGATPTITNSTFSANLWNGVDIASGNTVTISGTAFNNNGGWAMGANANTTLADMTGLSASGNASGNAIGYLGGTITGTERWRSSTLPFDISGNVGIASGATLTIDPGVVVKVAAGKEMDVSGRLTAIGTAANPILFTSDSALPWNTLYFYGASASVSQLSYAIILYGGQYLGGILIDSSSPSVDHVTVSNSLMDGILVTGAGAAPTITTCAIVSSAGYGINLVSGARATISGTTLTNSGNYAIGAEGGTSLLDLTNLIATGNGSGAKNAIGHRQSQIRTNDHWRASTLPWEVAGDIDIGTDQILASLTIDPGTTVRFGSGRAMSVFQTLTAIGTAAAPITFTSNAATPAPGAWNCIHFFKFSSASQIAYASVNYSGNDTASLVIDDAAPTFDHVTIANSSQDAVRVNGFGKPVLHNCQFINAVHGITNTGSEQVDAKLCYWSAASGPSILGAGTGLSASGYVTYDPWLTAPPSSAQYVSGVTVQNRVFNPALSVFASINPSFAVSGNWTLTILDSTACSVLRTYTGSGTTASVTWDGKDSGGLLQPAGSYRFHIANTAPGNLVATVARGVLTLSNASYLPTLAITSIVSGQTLSNVYQNGSSDVSVVGSVRNTALRNWVLDYGLGTTPTSWTQLTSGTTEKNAAQLYLWPTLPVTNAGYVLRLRSWDSAGNDYALSLPITVGNFQITQPGIYQLNQTTGDTITYTSLIPFTLTETVVFKNAAGTTMRTLVNTSRAIGSYSDAWNGRGDTNQYLPDAPYFYVATVTDGSHTMTWDLSNQYLGGTMGYYVPSFSAFDPFNNQPLTFTYSSNGPARNYIAVSPNAGEHVSTCDPPNFCLVNGKYEEGGTQHTISWAGVNATGALQPAQSMGAAQDPNKFQQNAVVVFGTKPTVTNVRVTPPVAGIGTSQTVSFSLTTFQNQTANITITFLNQGSLSVLRTIQLTGQSPGTVSVTWDGKADNGMPVAPGFYTITVTATDSIGNQASGQILGTIKN
jgi:flagellar hook assembly protein FlgD